MTDLKQKFVINDGNLILGRVGLHSELVEHRDCSLTVGGGEWFYNNADNTMYFWGKSTTFGQVTKEQFDAAWKQPSVENANIVFTTDLKSPI